MDEKPVAAAIFELPGEPAVVITGLPPLQPSDDPVNGYTNDASEPLRTAGFGNWIIGRQVRKSFGEQLYCGTVTGYDGEMGWYRVVYEDGDSEDLEWTELKELLEPLDIMVPLKTLATRVVRKQQKALPKSMKPGARSRARNSVTRGDSIDKGKTTQV